MEMKKAARWGVMVILGASLTFGLTQCNKEAETVAKDAYRISGTVTNTVSGGKAVLKQIIDGGLKATDSVEIDKEGKFTLQGKLPQAGPAIYVLNVNNLQDGLVILDSGSTLQAQFDGKNPEAVPVIKGSPAMDRMNKVDELAAQAATKREDLNRIFYANQARANDKTLLDSLRDADAKIGADLANTMKGLIREWGADIVSLQAVRFLDANADIDFLDSLARQYKVARKGEMQGVTEFVDMVSRLAKVRAGAMAPAIDLPTPEGGQKSLASLKGQVVLVDFWASWCGPCRRENPNVVKLYNQYKAQGFTVLGVSLDDDKNKWVEAIKKDGLAWHHVSELKRWESAVAQDWQVSQIPTSFLIDREGKIAARDLHGEELVDKVEELLAKK